MSKFFLVRVEQFCSWHLRQSLRQFKSMRAIKITTIIVSPLFSCCISGFAKYFNFIINWLWYLPLKTKIILIFVLCTFSSFSFIPHARLSRSTLPLIYFSLESFQSNSTGVRNWCSQICFKFLLFALFVPIREVFPENFSLIAQFRLVLWLIKVLEIVRKFLFFKFLSFSGTPNFR